MEKAWQDFPQVWVVDYEFIAGGGEKPIPICYCAREVYTGKEIKKWIGNEPCPEYPTSDDALFVAFFASAEMGCHIALGWSRPRNILDLYAEFRNDTNGKYTPAGWGLLGACTYYGIEGGDATYKESMRDRILKGAPYTTEEREQILEYCMKDVTLTTKLFLAMKNQVDLQRALLRGRYMWATAMMEYNGVPIDVESLQLLRSNWGLLKGKLIEKIDANYHVYDGTVFKTQKFLDYLSNNNIPWEFTLKNRPRTDDDFFKEQAKCYPALKPLQELRYTLGQLKLNDLQVGGDGRNRALLSPFKTKTGRNAPSSSKFIFGNAVWLRNLVKPVEGMALAYVDYSQQEIAIAASLSGDAHLKEAYESGDPYIAFAKQAKVVPMDATKKTHPAIREQFKTCMLGINYGMGVESFSRSAGISLVKAKELYKMHRIVYRQYWDWVHSYMDEGQLLGKVTTRYGWNFYTRGSSPSSLQNHPMQAHGANILQVAVCLCLENGIRVVAPVHDAILIEAPAGVIDKDVEKTQWLMEEASKHVIDYCIKTDATIIKHPDHYTDARGQVMWDAVWEVIRGLTHE